MENKLFETRRAQGLCYKCGDKYFPGHQCKSKQLNALTGTTDACEELYVTTDEGGDINEIEEEVIDEPISLNALSGIETTNTIRLRGTYGKQELTILVDCGSTHSFFATETDKQVGCIIKQSAPMRITVANGSHLMSYHTCPNICWKTQGLEFLHDLRLLNIGGVILC